MDVETFVVPPLDNNVYLVYDADAKEAGLVDAALSAAKVVPRIKELGLTLKYVLNTHGHADHIADDVPIAKGTGAKIGIHEADAYRFEQVAKNPPPFLPSAPPNAKPDVLLKEGTVVEVGGVKLRVLHTPGHTQGSACFYVEDEGYLFSGDTLLAGKFGDTNVPGASPAFMWQSLRRLWNELPPATKVLPGHGPPTRIADETWIPNLRYAAPH